MMSDNEKLQLIKRNLKELTGEEIIKNCLKNCGTMNIYWGTAPTGKPHIGYFVPMAKLADFLKAGCHVTVLFANIHAYLDNMKAPWELLEKRSEYYQVLIKGMLKALHVPVDKLRFVLGTEFQLNENYAKALYELVCKTSVKDAAKAGCEVVKQLQDPFLSNLIYPLMQAIDEEFLGADAEFGGLDQRKIFMFAEKKLPSLSFAKRAHLMNQMLPGLKGNKMSASEEDSKIDLLESEEMINTKIRAANCDKGTWEKNGILAMIKCVALPNKNLFNNDMLNTYNDIKEIEENFNNGELKEENLKEMLGSILWTLMQNLRGEFTLTGKENLIEDAYPTGELPATNENKTTIKNISQSIFQKELDTLAELFPEISLQSLGEIPAISNLPNILWSCRVTAEPHIGYLIPLRKLALLSQRNWKVTLLLEDIGGLLHSKNESNKLSWNAFPERTALYREIFRNVFVRFGGKTDNLDIVVGSEFQLSKDYLLLLYRSLSQVSEKDCQIVLKKIDGTDSESKSLSSVLYPCMSVLDQLYLRVNVRLFGYRQSFEEIRAFGTRLSGKLELKERMPLYVTHENLFSLDGKTFMTSAQFCSKNPLNDRTSISLYNSEKIIIEKIQKAFLDPNDISRDCTLDIIEKIIWPQLKDSLFRIERSDENGGDVNVSSVNEIKKLLQDNKIHPADIKKAAATNLFHLVIEPMHDRLTVDLYREAFPEKVNINKIIKSSFSPNSIDIRVALVDRIEKGDGQHGSNSITLKIGPDTKTIVNKGLCQMTPGNRCLAVTRPSTNTNKSEIIGLLTSSTTGSVLKLKKKVYSGVVSFENHDAVNPHLKLVDDNLIIKMINEKFRVKDGYLLWSEDGSLANEMIVENVLEDGINVKC